MRRVCDIKRKCFLTSFLVWFSYKESQSETGRIIDNSVVWESCSQANELAIIHELLSVTGIPRFRLRFHVKENPLRSMENTYKGKQESIVVYHDFQLIAPHTTCMQASR